MNTNQKGFSVVEVLLVVIVVGLIGFVGWSVFGRENSSKTTENTSTSQSENQKETAPFTDCHTEVDKVTKTLESGMSLYEWTTVEHTKVILSDWDVALTLPENLVGEAVCRYTSNGYEFSTTSIINDDKCVAYYRTNELTSEGVELWQYPSNTAAESQFSGITGSLEDYYNANKTADGNYFTGPGTGRNYYKIGNNFYVAFGDANGVLDKRLAARTEACKGAEPNFKQPFVEAMATLENS